MYELVVTDANVDEKIVEGITKLYFESKKYLRWR